MQSQAIELIAILLSLSGFGVDKNPSPPASIDIVKYAPGQADYMMYTDFETVLPKNYDAFLNLPKHKAIRGNTAALKPLLQAIKEAEAGRRLVKGMLGFDPARDINHAAVFANVPTRGPVPEALVVVRGSFPADLLDKVSNLANRQVRMVNGHPAIDLPMNMGMVAFIAKDGTILAGNSAWVTSALGAKRNRRPKRGSAMARFARLIDQRPFMLIASNLSASSKRFLRSRLRGGPERLMGDILTTHKFASFAVNPNGLSWSWTDETKRGYQRAVLGSKGIINTLRAYHFGARGVAQMGFAAIQSFGHKRQIARILRNQKALLGLLNSWSGDGKFKVRMNRRAATNTIEVKAWGKKLSDVVPMGGILPLAAVGALVGMRGSASPKTIHARPTAKRARSMRRPSRILRTYRKVKRAKLQRPGQPQRSVRQ